MSVHNKSGRFTLLLAIAALWLMVGLSATTRAALAQPNGPADPVAAVMAMTAAYNTGNAALLRDHLDSSFVGITLNPPPGYPPEYVRYDREGFISSSVGGARASASCRQTAADTAVCDTTLTGAGLPPTAHPWHSTITFTVTNGKITRLQEMLSQQTFNEIAQLGATQPGMPSTGAAHWSAATAVLVLALGALALVLGALLRRASRGQANLR